MAKKYTEAVEAIGFANDGLIALKNSGSLPTDLENKLDNICGELENLMWELVILSNNKGA